MTGGTLARPPLPWPANEEGGSAALTASMPRCITGCIPDPYFLSSHAIVLKGLNFGTPLPRSCQQLKFSNFFVLTSDSTSITTMRSQSRLTNNAIMMHLLATTNVLFLLSYAAHGFAPLPQMGRYTLRHSPTELYYNDDRYTNDEVKPIPNDFKMFLTQCSIQSFLFLLRSMRDPETVMWLEEFTQPAIKKKHDYGLGVAILEDARMVDEQEYDEEDDDDSDDEEESDEDDDDEQDVVGGTNDEATNDNDGKCHTEPATYSKTPQVHVLAPSSTTDFPTWVVSIMQASANAMAAPTMTTIPTSIMKPPRTTTFPTWSVSIMEGDDKNTYDDKDTEEARKSSKFLQNHALAASSATSFPCWVASVMESINTTSSQGTCVMKASNTAAVPMWSVSIMDASNEDEEATNDRETKGPTKVNKFQQYHVLAVSHVTTFPTWVASVMAVDLTIFPTWGTSVVKASKNSGTIPFNIWGVKAAKDSKDAVEEAPVDIDEECPPDIEEPRKFSTLLQYHGLAALNTTIFPTWDAYFEKLLQKNIVHYTIVSSFGGEYELDIDPSSLCSRLVSVREQISREFVRDLEVISQMSNRTLESYWEKLKQQTESDYEDSDIPIAFERENLLFLELNVGDHAPSPLRKGNFDLLMLLTTQESIHRVLHDKNRQGGPERVTNEYLKQFYFERVHYFRGPQRYGRADDFIEELLSRNPRMITVAEGVTSLIDPTRIAELVLKAREEVALEWKELAAEASKDHMAIQRMRLNKMMGVTEVETEEPFQ